MIVKKKGRRWKYPAYFAASCKRETFFPEMAHIFPEKRRKPLFFNVTVRLQAIEIYCILLFRLLSCEMNKRGRPPGSPV